MRRATHFRFSSIASFRLEKGILLCLLSAFLGINNDALDWQPAEGARVAAVTVPASGKPGFHLLSPEETGVQFTNILTPERAMANANLMNGSGVALGDYDGDGLCDIYLCNLNGTNALYKNLGNWKFKDTTAEAGVACPGQTSTGAVFADINGDGSLDLLVTSMGGPNACFLNDGHGHFRNTTAEAGITSKLGSTSMALADIDGDGTLDLYVAYYGVNSILRSGGGLAISYVNGQPVVRGRNAQRVKIVDGMMYELGEPDILYLNDGKGKFTPLSWTDGRFLDESGQPLAQVPWDQGLSAIFHDINGDGFPDIYVCNDAFTPDRCWINDGHGHFRALNHLALRSTSYFSMGADFADIDRDGHDDLFVVDMLSRQHQLKLTQKSQMHPQPRIPGDLSTQLQIRRNTLFLNRGDGTYSETANYSGLAASDWTWSCIFLDVDLDGWEDILVSNGFPHDVDDFDTKDRVQKMGKLTLDQSRKTMLLYRPLRTPDYAFRNQHDLTFAETGKAWGFDSLEVSNGMALADLDNDGDLDIVVNCLNGPALIYRNEANAPRLGVRLRGKAPNTQGIGAKIKVLGGPVAQSQEVMCGGRYMSGDDPMRVFAAGASTDLMIEVTWRNGGRSVIDHARPSNIYEIDETAASKPAATEPATPSLAEQALFEDASLLLSHRHHEEQFDDFVRQPLLSKRLSQLGPGVAWFDVDGDGRDDLIVGTGRNGRLALYRNEGQQKFKLIQSPALSEGASRDQTTILGWVSGPNQRSLLVGSASYEDGLTNGESVLRFDFSEGGLKPAAGLPAMPSSVGPLALTDMDGDGNVDLFVGGRVIPGRYPEAASSQIYRYDGKQWQRDAENSKVLEQVGLVSGAVWSDLDGDGLPELILACEWGPIRVFKNESGKLHEITAQLGLDKFVGWWNGVTTGDIDGDGKLDIIAANWGLNSQYTATSQQPSRLYYGELGDGGSVDMIEASNDPEFGIAPMRDLGPIGAALPFLTTRFPTYAAFASTNIQGILGDKISSARELQANTLNSTVFLNRGSRFEAVPLPAEAQLAPAFAVCVSDVDGDGHEDIFLSQNFFGTPAEVPQFDGGRGLWLRGNGTGRFTPLRYSGIAAYGEQRGAALCDYDEDGRIDLVLTQNGGETKLYHNIKAKPGLRVRLSGPVGNPQGFGAQIHLIASGKSGPVRELHAGSGYWSQESATQVLATPEPPIQIWVRWPGGKITTSDVPSGANTIQVDAAGLVTKLH